LHADPKNTNNTKADQLNLLTQQAMQAASSSMGFLFHQTMTYMELGEITMGTMPCRSKLIKHSQNSKSA